MAQRKWKGVLVIMTGIKSKSAVLFSGAPIIAAVYCATHIRRSDGLMLLLNVLILSFGYIAAIYDIREKRIPNKLILIMLASWFVSIFPGLFINTGAVLPLVKDSLIGFLMGGGIFITIYLISKKGLGGGDVKFIAAAGLYLGLNGCISTILCGTLLSALVGLSLIMLKKIERKTPIPLVPFLYIGILVTLFLL